MDTEQPSPLESARNNLQTAAEAYRDALYTIIPTEPRRSLRAGQDPQPYSDEQRETIYTVEKSIPWDLHNKSEHFNAVDSREAEDFMTSLNISRYEAASMASRAIVPVSIETAVGVVERLKAFNEASVAFLIEAKNDVDLEEIDKIPDASLSEAAKHSIKHMSEIATNQSEVMSRDPQHAEQLRPHIIQIAAGVNMSDYIRDEFTEPNLQVDEQGNNIDVDLTIYRFRDQSSTTVIIMDQHQKKDFNDQFSGIVADQIDTALERRNILENVEREPRPEVVAPPIVQGQGPRLEDFATNTPADNNLAAGIALRDQEPDTLDASRKFWEEVVDDSDTSRPSSPTIRLQDSNVLNVAESYLTSEIGKRPLDRSDDHDLDSEGPAKRPRGNNTDYGR